MNLSTFMIDDLLDTRAIKNVSIPSVKTTYFKIMVFFFNLDSCISINLLKEIGNQLLKQYICLISSWTFLIFPCTTVFFKPKFYLWLWYYIVPTICNSKEWLIDWLVRVITKTSTSTIQAISYFVFLQLFLVYEGVVFRENHRPSVGKLTLNDN